MKKQTKEIVSKIIVIIFLSGLISCRSISTIIAKRTGEFQNPQEETEKSIIKHCQDNDVNYDQLFVLKSEDNFKSFVSKYKDIPCIFVFDKNKLLMTTAKKTNCPWTMINFLFDTTIRTKKVSDTSLYMEIISHFNMIDNKLGDNQADYYILCTWAKFVPKLSNALFETINKQKKENKLNVCHVLLNVDIQKSWELED